MKHQRIKNHQNQRSLFTLSVIAASLFTMNTAFAAYEEPGVIGDKASWETPEYQRDWGLAAMHASSAYALGFHGQNALVGVMDSGALMKHPELNNSRFNAVAASGVYGSTGMRCPQINEGAYTKGSAFDVTGDWIEGVNDTHGTHVAGTVGAARDGNEMHGVAWGANVFVGNTGGTDNSNYGPYHDYDYFYTGWKAIASQGVGVINNSWGTNIRIEDNKSEGPDGGNTGVHLPVNSTADTEYEYFYFQKMYAGQPSFVQAAFDAVKDTQIVQVFTTGNRDFANPYHRPLYPYFHPETEQHWVAVAGLQQEEGKYTLIGRFNEAGNAKWWTVVAPGMDIYSSKVGLGTETEVKAVGEAYWANSSGTSMAAPHVTGAMGVLMSRYPDMTGIQIRDVMFTTANHTNEDGSLYANWTAKEGVPDVRYGWGTPDLDKGMYGPAQLLGTFTYTVSKNGLDVWTNSISETALNARQAEDEAWLSAYKDKGIAAGGNYNLGEQVIVNDGNDDKRNHIIALDDAKKWRAAYYLDRANAIEAKLTQGLYQGQLVKRGQGVLVLTGDNQYSGGTVVEEGQLYGFTESFGEGKTLVKGGQFGILADYQDTLTKKGELTSTAAHKATIEVAAGATFAMDAGKTTLVKEITFNQGAKVAINTLDNSALNARLHKGETVVSTLSADKLIGADTVELVTYAGDGVITEMAITDNTLTVTLIPVTK